LKRETIDGRRWVGRVLRERWRIDERLSRGGVGTVYAATHMNNGSRAAIKVLHPEFARDPDTKSRFLQEGYAANQVNHPGVVRIIDDDTTEDGHPFLVMELLEGELLEKRRVRKDGTLPLNEVYEIADQLLDVLAAAHEKGIVHRDIKPENLFITREGRLKVLDFGFAQMKSGFRHEQTATGFLLGTPGFMSPEQAVGNRAQIDAQTDIWAVGATLFTLISGEPVHDGQSAAEMLVAAANYPPRSLATVMSGLPPALVTLVDRALAFDKRDRWPSARAMQSALRELVARAAGPTRPPQYSIPERVHIDDEVTLYTPGDSVQELGSEDLIEASAKASWGPNEDRTVMAPPGRPLPAQAIPSEVTRPHADARHAADDDGPTLAGTSPLEVDGAPTDRPPATPHMLVDPTVDAGTLIMDGSAHLAAAGPVSAAPTTAPKPFGQQGFAAPTPPPFAPYGAPGGAGEAALSPAVRTGPAQALAPQGGSRVLAFVGVVIVTMVVVILSGLLVLALAD